MAAFRTSSSVFLTKTSQSSVTLDYSSEDAHLPNTLDVYDGVSNDSSLRHMPEHAPPLMMMRTMVMQNSGQRYTIKCTAVSEVGSEGAWAVLRGRRRRVGERERPSVTPAHPSRPKLITVRSLYQRPRPTKPRNQTPLDLVIIPASPSSALPPDTVAAPLSLSPASLRTTTPWHRRLPIRTLSTPYCCAKTRQVCLCGQPEPQ